MRTARAPSRRARCWSALLLVLLAGAIVAGTMFWLGRQDPAATRRAGADPRRAGPVQGQADRSRRARRRRRQRDRLFDQRRRGPGRGARRAQAAAGDDAAAGRDRGRRRAAQENPAQRGQGAGARTIAAPAAPSGPTIQLGAYASTVKADTAWKLLSGRFPEVAALKKAVVTATVGGKSIYRLRASGSSEQTKAACAALRAAGESCLVVN